MVFLRNHSLTNPSIPVKQPKMQQVYNQKKVSVPVLKSVLEL